MSSWSICQDDCRETLEKIPRKKFWGNCWRNFWSTWVFGAQSQKISWSNVWWNSFLNLRWNYWDNTRRNQLKESQKKVWSNLRKKNWKGLLSKETLKKLRQRKKNIWVNLKSNSCSTSNRIFLVKSTINFLSNFNSWWNSWGNPHRNSIRHLKGEFLKKKP